MEPIISSWFFYFMEVGDSLNIVAVVFAIIAGIIWVGLWIAGLCFFDVDNTFEENLQNKVFQVCWRSGKKAMIVMFILITTTVVIPSKQTMVEMVATQQITPDNLDKGKDVVKSATDYIFEKLKETKSTDSCSDSE